jgi:phage terminase Nu1 subunit (DNA packaging protein)
MAPGTPAAAPEAPAPRKETSVAFACVSQVEIAAILGVVDRQVRNLEKNGLPREAEGYPVARCVRWYVEFKQTEAIARVQPKERSARDDADERRAIAEAEAAELRVRKERGLLVETSVFEAELRRIVFGMRREINNLVGVLSPEVLHLTDLASARRVIGTGRDRLLRRLQQIAGTPMDADTE